MWQDSMIRAMGCPSLSRFPTTMTILSQSVFLNEASAAGQMTVITDNFGQSGSDFGVRAR